MAMVLPGCDLLPERMCERQRFLPEEIQQIRNMNIEIRNNIEYQKFEIARLQTLASMEHLAVIQARAGLKYSGNALSHVAVVFPFRISNLFRISIFGFRILTFILR